MKLLVAATDEVWRSKLAPATPLEGSPQLLEQRGVGASRSVDRVHPERDGASPEGAPQLAMVRALLDLPRSERRPPALDREAVVIAVAPTPLEGQEIPVAFGSPKPRLSSDLHQPGAVEEVDGSACGRARAPRRSGEERRRRGATRRRGGRLRRADLERQAGARRRELVLASDQRQP
jgi:hypothetical protein